MGVLPMHVKSDSEVTSIDASSPRRPLYYVQSPSQELEKMSYGSSPLGSPTHHFHYHCSPIHHSRESSTSRFSKHSGGGWRRMQMKGLEEEEGEEGKDDIEYDMDDDSAQLKFYVICFVLSFLLLFTLFSLIIWAASLRYKPTIVVKSIWFENFYAQAGMDGTGVATDMITLNSTVRILYRNPATFFGVHVTCSPIHLQYLDIKVASGQIKEFYQPRKSERKVVAVVEGEQVAVYGGIPMVNKVPLNLTVKVRSRAYILGWLVKPKFYATIVCRVTLSVSGVRKPLNLTKHRSCIYHY